MTLREWLIEMGIYTEDEIEIAEYFNGVNDETYDLLLYYRTGYRSVEQLKSSGEW